VKPWTLTCGCAADENDNRTWCPIHQRKATDPAPATDPTPLKVRPDFCGLVVAPGPDGVHAMLRLNCDVTALSEERRKLMVYFLARALSESLKTVRSMTKMDVASALGKMERQTPARKPSDEIT